MARVESVRVPAPGAILSARHYPGSGDPIVFLHGGPGLGDYFGSLPGMLSPPYRVVTYDQRGCGASRCEPSFEVTRQVADLDAVRSHFGASRIHIFGHSWGGLLGQLYAKAHPERVASLVLCCSMANTGRNVAMENKGIAERVMGRHKRAWLAWAAAGTLMQFPGRLGDVGFGHVMKQLLPNYFVRPENAPKAFEVTRVSKRAWRETGRSIKATNEHHLQGLSLTVPVFIVRGEHDVIRETNAVLVERFPSATNVCVENAGHFPWLEQSAIFSRALLAFYGEVAMVQR